LRFPPWKFAPSSSSPLPSLGRKLFCEAQASISVPSTEKCSSDSSGLTSEWLRSLAMNFAKHIAVLQPVAVFGESGWIPRPGHLAKAPRTSDKEGYSPVAPSTGAPTGCRRTPADAFHFEADRHQQQGAQQLRWDRGTSFAGVKLPEAKFQLTQDIPDKLPDLPQRMVRRHRLSGAMYENNPP
jgi:hypothetical protein